MTGTERLEQLVAGQNPAMVFRMPSGFVVMADWQFLPGYCILLAYPEANHLTDLSREVRSRYMLDMSILGEAIMAATSCGRINYGIYGNLDPFLHAHVYPRYDWENDPQRTSGPWSYSEEYIQMPEHAFTEEHHGQLKKQIALHLERLLLGSEI